MGDGGEGGRGSTLQMAERTAGRRMANGIGEQQAVHSRLLRKKQWPRQLANKQAGVKREGRRVGSGGELQEKRGGKNKSSACGHGMVKWG